MTDNTASEPSWLTPKAGMTLGYNANSEALRIFVCLFSGLAIYNALELIGILFLAFRKRNCLYFYALFGSALGIIPYSLGFMLKYLNITIHGGSKWVPMVLLTIGWYPMIVGQALVLWSRLHLIIFGVRGARVIRATKWMIIATAVCFLPPTTILTFGSNGSVDQRAFTNAYNIMEKIQMVGFCAQETILSSIYIIETVRLLRTSLRPDTRTTMRQLVAINVVIIGMDLALLGLECASLYILETMLKGVIYSIKLKLEFAILGKLVKFVRGVPRPSVDVRGPSTVGYTLTATATKASTVDNLPRQASKDNRDESVASFGYLEPKSTNGTDSARSRRSSATTNPRKMWREIDWEYDMARFEHIEDVTTLGDGSSAKSSNAPLREIEEAREPS